MNKSCRWMNYLKIGLLLIIGISILGIMGCKDDSLASQPNVPIAQVRNFVGDPSTLVFHKLTCKMAPKQDKGVYFDAPLGATSAGYKACKVCKPLEP